jgi:hypothetical protein
VIGSRWYAGWKVNNGGCLGETWAFLRLRGASFADSTISTFGWANEVTLVFGATRDELCGCAVKSSLYSIVGVREKGVIRLSELKEVSMHAVG